MQVLREIKHLYQNEKLSFRRLFVTPNFDVELYVWYELNRTTLTGFQFCYKRNRAEWALTWKQESGYSHALVDGGEDGPIGYKLVPVLSQGGPLDKEYVVALFEEKSTQMETTLASFILNKLKSVP